MSLIIVFDERSSKKECWGINGSYFERKLNIQVVNYAAFWKFACGLAMSWRLIERVTLPSPNDPGDW